MFCTGCGAKLEEDALFCRECGKKIEVVAKVNAAAAGGVSGAAAGDAVNAEKKASGMA